VQHAKLDVAIEGDMFHLQRADALRAFGERKGQARVTPKCRALAVKFSDEYLWFWIGKHNVNDTLTK
jgi:hypothetical protein